MKPHTAALSAAALLALVFASTRLMAATPAALLASGQVGAVIAQLSPAKDAAEHSLLCRAFYSEEHIDEAVHECEAAANAAPASSEYQRWLARVYGAKAEHVGKLSAFGLAKKIHAAMERAVQLDPHSADALSDLGDYDVDAPGMVGGGLDKANDIAQRLLAVNAARGHRLLARIAEKQGNTAQAEKEYTAAATGAHAAAGYVDLALFYQSHGSKQQVLSAVKSAVAADSARDYSIADAAGVLVESHQETRLAGQLYRSYLDGPSRSDDAPACRVYLQLGQLMAANGDTAAAQKAYAASLALAKNYAPAQHGASGSRR